MQIEIKRGATLAWPRTRVDSAGTPVDLTGVTVTAAVKLRNFTATLTVAVDNALAGEFTLSSAATATAVWPIATLECDVKYVEAGVVTYSETDTIIVTASVTP